MTDDSLTLSELATRLGISKQALSKKLTRLKAQGLLPKEEGEPGKPLKISIADFERATAHGRQECEGSDPVPEGLPVSLLEKNPVLIKEQARRTAYQADILGLELEEKLKRMVLISDVENMITRCSESLVRALELLPNRAEEILECARTQDVQAIRHLLKTVVLDLRKLMVSHLFDLVALADTKVQEHFCCKRSKTIDDAQQEPPS